MNLDFRNWLASASANRTRTAVHSGLLAGLLTICLLSAAIPANILAQGAPVYPEVQAKQKAVHPERVTPHGTGPTLSPAAPSATVGTSVTVTSNTPVTWSLRGVGTLSNQTSTSVTYTAPASVVPQHQMLGCQVLPNDTVFNTPADNLPLDPNSNAMIAAQIQGFISFEPSWGISYADNTTPTKTFLSYYDSVTHPNFVFPARGPNMRRESGDYVGIFSFGANRADHHVMTVRRTDCTFWESYDDYDQGYTRTCNDGVTPNCNIQSVTTYNSTNYKFTDDWGTDAGGFVLAPMIWHVDEVKSGTINHAVRFTEGLGGILANAIRWPASSTAGGCYTCPNTFPMGTRLRLKSSFNISSFSANAQVMLAALKKYGMILTDTGSNNAIQVSYDMWEDPSVGAALDEIFVGKILITNFEVVDESSLEVDPFSYVVCPYNTTCMGAQNTYEQPLNQAMLTATASGGSTSVPIGLQGVGIGLGVPSVLPIVAGSYSMQIPFWVNGTSNQTVNWTLQSGVGSVTSGGVYTPPSTTTDIGTTVATVLKGTSAADPNSVVYLYVKVLPAGASPVGSIRVDSGASANTTDGNGNVWLAETGVSGATASYASDYPSWKTTNPLGLMYQSNMVAYGSDFHYAFGVPNGNYRVHLLFGATQETCAPPCATWPNGTLDVNSFNPQLLETQGTTQIHSYNWGIAAGYSYTTPADIYIPAKVTNNILSVGVYPLAPDFAPFTSPAAGQKYNTLNGLEVLPDSSSPHWTIDTQQQTTIAPGQTLNPFYVIDWYTGINDPTWSIVSGPPGASMTGSVLSLASGSYYNAQPIVIKASDGTYSATTTIYTTGGTRSALGIFAPPAPVNHFSYKRAITVNHSYVAADQTNFPMVVSITDATLQNVANGGHVLNANGYDIVLTSDSAGTNRLNWEVEKYDSSAGTWIAHVQIPTLSHTVNTVIYAFYGNPAITTDQSHATAVWDSNFTGVYHMAKLTTATVGDSTSNGNNALVNQNVKSSATGEIGSAALFVGSDIGDHFELPPTVLNSTQGTISAWLKSYTSAVSGNNWASAAQVDSSNAFDFAYWTSYFGATIFGWSNPSGDYRLQISNTTLPLTANAWQHVVYSWNKSTNTQVVYLNGSPINTTTTAFTTYTPVNNFWVGTTASNGSYAFNGLIDEFRLSNIPRSASWVATEFNNQSAPASFMTIGSEASN